MSSTFEVVSGDGTRIRCWRSGTQGVPLLIQRARAQISVLPGSHFLPIEFPQEIHDLLDDLARRADQHKP